MNSCALEAPALWKSRSILLSSDAQCLAQSRTEDRDERSRSREWMRPFEVGISDMIWDTALSALEMLRQAR